MSGAGGDTGVADVLPGEQAVAAWAQDTSVSVRVGRLFAHLTYPCRAGSCLLSIGTRAVARRADGHGRVPVVACVDGEDVRLGDVWRGEGEEAVKEERSLHGPASHAERRCTKRRRRAVTCSMRRRAVLRQCLRVTRSSKVSAGLLLYRAPPESPVEVLLAHPGGPLWARRDEGAWTLPKGEAEPGEELLVAARKERYARRPSSLPMAPSFPSAR